MNVSVNEGDWVDGKVEWWWKYVLPPEPQFWAAILAQRVQVIEGPDPQPSPWLQAQAVGLEAVAMLQAVAKITDLNQRTSLLNEVVRRFAAAADAVKVSTGGVKTAKS